MRAWPINEWQHGEFCIVHISISRSDLCFVVLGVGVGVMW